MAEAEEVNQKTLARVLNLTSRQIRNLEEVGLPGGRVAENGRDRLYDLTVAVPWYVQRERERLKSTEKDEADIEKARAKAAMARLDLAEREGKLIPVALHTKLLGEILGEVRSRTLNLPGSVAPQLVGMDEEREVVAVLRPAVDRCLQSLVALADELDGVVEGEDVA